MLRIANATLLLPWYLYRLSLLLLLLLLTVNCKINYHIIIIMKCETINYQENPCLAWDSRIVPLIRRQCFRFHTGCGQGLCTAIGSLSIIYLTHFTSAWRFSLASCSFNEPNTTLKLWCCPPEGPTATLVPLTFRKYNFFHTPRFSFLPLQPQIHKTQVGYR